MTRPRRVVLGSLGFGLLLVFLYGLRHGEPPGSPANGFGARVLAQTQPRPWSAGKAPSEDPQPSLDRFNQLLGKLRANDESVVPEMREITERLCAVHDRCEGKQILDFYLALTPEERTRGLEEQQRFVDARLAVGRHWNEGRPDDQWEVFRDELLDELEAIHERTNRAGRDVFPGGCALSLCARTETDRLLSDAGLNEASRSTLLDRARQHATTSLTAFKKCGVLSASLQPTWLLGYLHSAAGEVLEARHSFADCLELAQRLGNTEWQEKAFQGLLDLAKEAGDMAEIAGLLEEMAARRTPQESWLLAKEHAILLLERDEGAAAADFLLAHPRSDPTERREWRLLLGSAHLRRGDLTAAREEFAQAEPLPWSGDVRRAMALVDLREGNAERALQQLSQPEFLEQASLLGRAYALELCGEALLKLGRIDEAASKLEQALEIGGEMQERLSPQRDVLGAATSVIGESVGVHAIALLAEARELMGETLESARTIENWQSRTLRGKTSATQEISKEDLLAWAGSTELGLVTWVVGVDSSVVAHVAPDGSAEGATIHRGRRAFEAGARRLNEALRSRDLSRANQLAAQIRSEILPQAIWSRIAGASGAGRDRLLVLVHGPVERLPIEFLLRDDPVIPLVLPGLPAPRPGPPIRPEDCASWNLLGAPTDSEGRQLLPGAREELAQIAALYSSRGREGRAPADVVEAGAGSDRGVRLHTGASFDRDAVLDALRSTRPLHVATHLKRGCGLDQGRIADVGLELSGGERICAHDMSEARPRPVLAVLGACETAEGRFVDAEGLQGVSRAFLESGTRDLLVTLWPVEDQAAREIACEFHAALLAGEAPSLAASTARARLRARGVPAADWAAFRLIGRD